MPSDKFRQLSALTISLLVGQQTSGVPVSFPRIVADFPALVFVMAVRINVGGIRYSDASDGQDSRECQAGHDAHQDDEDGAKKNRDL